jgi:hypothetical protein
MTHSYVKCSNSRGQLKIQQMAFVLVAMMIFFALVALFWVSLRSNTLENDVSTLREEEIIETVRKMSGSPELTWTSAGDCAACIDFDRALLLKERRSYDGFWEKIELLQIVRVHPTFGEGVECTRENYPECDSITLVEQDSNFRSQSAFVALCRYESVEGYNKCDLGKIIIAFEPVGE